MQPLLQSHSPSVLPGTATFHQRSLPGGVHCLAILDGLQMTDCISTAVLTAVLKMMSQLRLANFWHKKKMIFSEIWEH